MLKKKALQGAFFLPGICPGKRSFAAEPHVCCGYYCKGLPYDYATRRPNDVWDGIPIGGNNKNESNQTLFP